jgi:hypothetical protein
MTPYLLRLWVGASIHECYSLQGIDKCLKRLNKQTRISVSYGDNNSFRNYGNNNKRAYSHLCFDYVHAMSLLGSPYLKHWNIDTAMEYRDATMANGKNVGIAEYMDNRKMQEYLEVIGG